MPGTGILKKLFLPFPNGLRTPLSFQSYPWLFESPRSLHTKTTRSDSTFSKPFSIVTAHEQPRLHA